MTFFETVAGQRFTDYTLPKLAEELEKINGRKQYSMTIPHSELKSKIDKEISMGSKVVSMVNLDDQVLVIFEYI